MGPEWHRKRSGSHQPSWEEQSGSGAALAVVAVFISNAPEVRSSVPGMRRVGRVLGLWSAIMLAR
ncbi:hypothetical protein [Allokutzneria sp. NRRL B-24872]|uniref:hypothetical protein n=1 Tax=Allokutzneria sp. NRRL B-24872 TaxID=1137961 RepID=UPI000A386510|nr:hypothetical protein [Allokutzneria sp. NRRL B-24872]